MERVGWREIDEESCIERREFDGDRWMERWIEGVGWREINVKR
jgi:hypothetical protein